MRRVFFFLRSTVSGIAIGLVSLLFILSCRKPAPAPSLDFAARIEIQSKDLHAVEGERIPLRLQLTNTGRNAWDSSENPPCFLSYHLLNPDRSMSLFDNRRIPLPQRVEPAQSIDLEIQLRCPLQKGEFIVEFDLLREGVAWFKDNGSLTEDVRLTIAERYSDYEIGLDYGRYTRFSSVHPEIEKIFVLLRMTLDANKAAFSGISGPVRGFSPGSDYPQIWLRDSNTIIPAARWFFRKEWLVSWLEEHLAYQKSDGSLHGWIDSRGVTDKNTTETDQESSAVQSAYQFFRIMGPVWLNKKVEGKSVISRLEAALDSVIANRLDPRTGLIRGAHTADWGDVDLVDPDHNAVYVDERTHWTVDIYDQGMFYQACLELGLMLGSLDQKERADRWARTAAALRRAAQDLLWQEGRGFFAVHRHLDALAHDFDEDDIFAMGGNVQAILSGLAEPLQSRRIIETALARQTALGISTVSGTLLPPYPSGVFKHHMMDDPFEYQNGAQWDWFGYRLIYAMYESGYSEIAGEKLLEIIRKNLDNRGFFEWDNRDGVAWGSDLFCGSAGSLAKALFSGYYGIDLENGVLRLAPKLGTDSGRIHLYQAATDTFVAYIYRYDQENRIIDLEINSNLRNKGTLKILIPEEAKINFIESETSPRVLLDGIVVPTRKEIRNSDAIIVLDLDFDHHKIKVHFDEILDN